MTMIRDLPTLLRESRLAKHLTQHQLARRLGVRPERLARWETGREVPTWATLHELIQLLDLQQDELLLARLAAMDGDRGVMGRAMQRRRAVRRPPDDAA